MPKKLEAGFSLTEALIVVVLIGAILAIAIPALATFLNNYRIQTAASQFAVQVRFARNAAVKQKLIYKVQIDETEDAYRVEKQTTYGSSSYEFVPGISGTTKKISGDEYVRLPTGVTINSASTDGPIEFTYRGANAANTSYSIIFDTVINVRYTVTISPSGGVTTTRTIL